MAARGKVGLVLAGGVAKGAYEAGVLKAIAQKGVVPAVIVGISAGAINGTFAASAIARGAFKPETVDDELIWLWENKVNAQSLYDCLDTDEHSDFTDRSLSSLFSRLGIDPLRRQYRPRIGWDTIIAFEKLVKGDFVSLISHGFLKAVLEARLFPVQEVVQHVVLSIVATDLHGSTAFTEDGDILPQYSYFEEFRWQNRPQAEWEDFIVRLRQLIVASSSFPFAFPPCPTDLGDGKRHLLADGGIMDCSPIGRAIRLDPDIDTVLVSLGPTMVESAETLPPALPKLMGRVFTMLAGKYLITNFRKVQQVNRKIERLRTFLDHDKRGRVLHTKRNEDLCLAAGFTGLEQFLERRVVKLVPIYPVPSLSGDVFDAFFKPKLMRQYIEQGYEDTLAALHNHALVPPPVEIKPIRAHKRAAVPKAAANE